MICIVKHAQQRDQLILANLGLVAYTVGELRLQYRSVATMGRNEALSAGHLALLQAAQGYDGTRAKFSTYATPAIRRAVLREASHRSVLATFDPTLEVIECPQRPLEESADDQLIPILGKLRRRDRWLLERRFGIGTFARTVAEIALEDGISRTHAHRRVGEALATARLAAGLTV